MNSGQGHLHGKPPGRRERKKIETRRKIFRSAFELFSERGFEGTTVKEIAERADVAKGTVFNYFPEKRAFLLAAHQEWMTGLDRNLGPAEEWQGPVRAQLGRVLDYMADLSIDHRDLSRMVIFENMKETFLRLEARGSPDPQAGVRPLESLVRTVIGRGMEASEIRSDVNDEQAASLIATTAFSTIVRWLVKGGSADDMKAALAAKLDIIFMGLAP